MKITYVIMSDDEVIGKVYQHPTLGRTVCFEGTVKMDSWVKVWKIEEDGNYTKVEERMVLEMFRDMLPL